MSAPKAVFDTNVYLTYLLSPNPAGTVVNRLLDAAATGVFRLLLPIDVIVELNSVVRDSPRIARIVTQHEVERLLRLLSGYASVLPLLEADPPAVCRDPKDDYLLAVSILHAADVLVTRDEDLLSLGPLLGLEIIEPGAFLAMIRPNPEG